MARTQAKGFHNRPSKYIPIIAEIDFVKYTRHYMVAEIYIPLNILFNRLEFISLYFQCHPPSLFSMLEIMKTLVFKFSCSS